MTTATKEKAIGTVIHFYDKLGVAIVELTGKLSVGDTVTFKRGDSEFTQTVDSMQVDHEGVEKAKKGDVVGMKVDQEVKEGATVVMG